MINEYVSDIANQMGVKLAKVSLTGGPTVACIDYRLEIESKNHLVRKPAWRHRLYDRSSP